MRTLSERSVPGVDVSRGTTKARHNRREACAGLTVRKRGITRMCG
ncbi:hypothetical protein FB565_000643 [Actinoplanes lutulentus]|uniref:Uncharacterized protein n=1 Tax=Actinoplanes lutulentus TaxID=1287878 RepID=A0A327ZQM2_9ACTN|nr:hypothetical protein [Actinoplanes lutulentus]RAK43248.1 hypothetical protein B0I29_101378 [Actinoplanes lutulentus]